ncbi:MAG: hypothetical protein IT379_14095 [Deltaproteobacteria bacterium]|nr:hypothetical protein [Deltaproteobacteria bacterium]
MRRPTRSDQHGLIALVGASIALRVAYLIDYSQLPFLWGPLFDSRVYLRQAASILGGRLDDPASIAFSPLYGWFLAMFGARPFEQPIHVQLLLGVVNVVLVHQIGLVLGGRTTGLLAGLAYSAYGLFVFHETKLMTETVALTWLLVAMRLWVSPRFDRGDRIVSIAIGSLLAVAVLTRSSLLPSIPCFVVAAAMPWRGAPTLDARGRLVRAGLLLVGLLVPLALHGAWSHARFGLFVPVTLASSTAARATSTSDRWTGDLAVLRHEGTRDVSPYDVVREAERRVAVSRSGGSDASPLAGIDWIGWARGAPRKIVETFADIETTSEYGFYGERSEVPVLRALSLSFGAIALLALLGAAWIVRRRGPWALVPWLPLVVGTSLLTTLFHPSSRYRLPMVVPLVLVAAFGVASTLRLRDVRARIGAMVVVALIVGGFAARSWRYELRSPALWETRVAESAVVRGDLDEARRRIARARSLAPGDPDVARSIRRITRGMRGATQPPGGERPE